MGAGASIMDTIAVTSHSNQDSYEASLAKNGRTFHWARRFLGAKHGADAARLYAFCRLLDDLADGDLPHGARRLSVICDDIARLANDPHAALNDPDMAEFAPFMARSQISLSALQHLIDGLLFDQGDVRLADEAALVKYGYQVAGTVGVMMCPVLSCHDKVAQDFAIDLGIAMQFTNIARDVLEDAKMGRRYLPASWVAGLSPDEIEAGALSGDAPIIRTVQSAIRQLLGRADAYYKSGMSGLCFLPKRAQVAIAIAAYSYRQIGVQLLAKDVNWHEGRTVTSTATKARVSLKALSYLAPKSAPSSHDERLHTPLVGYAK